MADPGVISDWDQTKPINGAADTALNFRTGWGAIQDALFENEASFDGGFIRSGLISRASATTLTVTPCMAWVSTTKRLKKKTTSTTLDITTSGVAGLDTGSVAADTWYYIWLIHETATGNISFMLSASSTTPTNPTGWTAERLIDAWWRGDATTGLKPGYTLGDGRMRERHWVGAFADSTKDSLFQLENGTATSATSLNLSTLGGVPPANVGDNLVIFPSRIRFYILKTGSGTDGLFTLQHNTVVSGDALAMHLAKNFTPSEPGHFLLPDGPTVKYKVNAAGFAAYFGIASYTFLV